MRSLSTKLTIAFFLVSVVGAALVALLVQAWTHTAFDRFVGDREQELLIGRLEDYYQSYGTWEGFITRFRNDITPADRTNPRRRAPRYTLVGTDQKVIFSDLTEKPGQTISPGALNNGIRLTVNGNTVGWVFTSPMLANPWLPDTPEASFLNSVNRASLISATIAALLAICIGGVLAYTLTRTLRDLTQATHAIARGELGRQVKVHTRDELGELATSFNKMSAELARASIARRKMTADIAHDLRTPLSVISGYTEALNDGKLVGSPEIYTVLYQETRLLSHLVDDLRILSLADAGELHLTRIATDPQLLLEREARRHAVAANEKSISLRIAVPAGLPRVDVDPDRIAQVFDNLISNALRYTPAGGEIVLSAAAQGNSVLFQVHDSGDGISAKDLPNIFERFYRGDSSRQQNGESGLGLAIARSIVETHGGNISAESQPGAGTTFIIRLPAVPPSSQPEMPAAKNDRPNQKEQQR